MRNFTKYSLISIFFDKSEWLVYRIVLFFHLYKFKKKNLKCIN